MTQKQDEDKILAEMEKDLATITIADQVTKSAPWLWDAKPALPLDDGNRGFPPIEPPEPTYGGRRPGGGRRAPGDLPLWLAITLIWGAVVAAWVIDTAQQRMIDKPLVILVGIGGTVGLLGLEIARRRAGAR